MPGTSGNDVLQGTPGRDLIDGGAGRDTADYSWATTRVNVSLAAGSATIVTSATGYITSQPSMLIGENGFEATALFSSGLALVSSTVAGGTYTPPLNFDGIGALRLNASTVRLLINHEIAPGTGGAYTVSNGAGGVVSLTGARISYVDLDVTTLGVVGSGIAYSQIRDRSGAIVQSDTQFDQAGGLSRFCSASLFESNSFGAGRGVVDQCFFAGQETGNGTGYFLDVASETLWAVPALGYGSFENVCQLDTGNTTQVAFLLSSDVAGAPMFLYVGSKASTGDFLDRNGLKSGQLYVWKADSGDTSSAQFQTGSRSGAWIAIDVQDPSKAGTTGYDAQGFKHRATIQSEALALGAFSFARPEDVSVNPSNGAQAVFSATGGSTADPAGAVYTLVTQFPPGGPPTGTLSVLYDGDLDPLQALRNPDNLDWADDGYIYVQEDRSTPSLFGSRAVNPNEASVVRIDPATGSIERIAHINRGAVPSGQTDANAGSVGAWESTGIVDVSSVFGRSGGTVFVSAVMATGVSGRSGQVQLLTAPGAGFAPASVVDTLISIEDVIGSAFSDTIAGSLLDNYLSGGDGDDWIDGGGGRDLLIGGAGRDTLLGSAGIDTLVGGEGADILSGGPGSDKLLGGAGSDVFVVGHDSGTDLISRFDPLADRIEIVSSSGAVSYAQLVFEAGAAGLVIKLPNSGSIVLSGMQIEMLNARHFTFTAATEEPKVPDVPFFMSIDFLAPGNFDLSSFVADPWVMPDIRDEDLQIPSAHEVSGWDWPA